MSNQDEKEGAVKEEVGGDTTGDSIDIDTSEAKEDGPSEVKEGEEGEDGDGASAGDLNESKDTDGNTSKIDDDDTPPDDPLETYEVCDIFGRGRGVRRDAKWSEV